MKRSLRSIVILSAVLFLSAASQAASKTIRATELGASMWSELSRGKPGDIVVEFRQGDELPLAFHVQGDLIETVQPSISYVGVKKSFWLRFSEDSAQISFDGGVFKGISQVLTGSLNAGTGSSQGSGGVADEINIVFNALLK